MKKIARILFVAAIASVALVSCKKDQKPAKEDNKEQNQDQDKDKEQQEEVKLAIDGKFGEWASINPVEGDDAILLTKTQTDDKNLYFYLEADLDQIVNEKHDYANKMYLCLDCGGDGNNTLSYWGGEEGCSYDVLYEIWLMANGNSTMAHWYQGVAGKSKIENGVYRAEISVARSANELFESKTIWYGMYLCDTICDGSYPDEVYGGGDLIGLSPVQDAEMAKVK